jgi:5-methylcytosine-specific restriction endonuclease McrA
MTTSANVGNYSFTEQKLQEKEILEFKQRCKYFVSGNTFSGFFDISPEHLNILFYHFKETGEYLLTAYCRVIYLTWEKRDNKYSIDQEEKNVLDDALCRIRRLRIFESDIIFHCNQIIKEQYNNHRIFKEYSFQRPRREAQSFISKKNIRKAVFELHGKKCLRCGSDKKISLDHIVPVFNGGANEIENLQPLCKSCNSKKGTNTIDYRKNE